MTFPKANIWQAIRSDCLDTIPRGSRFAWNNPITLEEWQMRGFYTVLLAHNRGFDLVSADIEIGSALLSDAEYFLDHAAEHQTSIWKQINNNDWTSPAWLVVTFYYWAFYLGLSLTRLLGSTVLFLNRDIVGNLTILANTSTGTAGAGPFRLSCEQHINATEREIKLTRGGTRVHDDLWRLLFNTLNEYVRNHSTRSGNSPEERLFACIQKSVSSLGHDWPSAIRNAVNYKSGFAYDTIRRVGVLESFRYLRPDNPIDIEQVVARFERNVVTVQTPNAILTAPKVVSRLLIDLTFLLHALTTELHQELITRNEIDNR